MDSGPSGDAAVLDAASFIDAGSFIDASSSVDAGPDPGTDAGTSSAERAALERAIRDACELFVSCYPDEYTLEDCIGYYTPYVDLALGMPGCAASLTSYLDCQSEVSCEELGDACESEGAAAAAACPELSDDEG